MNEPFPYWALAGLLGLPIGSFLNVVIHRLPREESVVFPPSRCPGCGHLIRPWDNVPVLSWILLGGRCRDCKMRISPRYPAVELLTALLFAGIVARFGLSPLTGVRLAFAAAMVAVVFIDLDYQIIPDVITLPGFALGMVASFFGPPGWRDALLGALVGGGSLFLIGWLWQKLRGIEAMGMGDVKLLLMVGAFTGWKGVLFTLMAASFVGAIAGVGLMLFRRAHMQTLLPFGVFLGPAAVVAFFAAAPFFHWYGGLIHR